MLPHVTPGCDKQHWHLRHMNMQGLLYLKSHTADLQVIHTGTLGKSQMQACQYLTLLTTYAETAAQAALCQTPSVMHTVQRPTCSICYTCQETGAAHVQGPQCCTQVLACVHLP